MTCREHEEFMVDRNGCFNCGTIPKVKGRFGLAWVSESPDCPSPEPVGWQVEFLDTPSKVEQKCQEMVRWINCPPLPRCDPCPPEELCCNKCCCQPCCKPKFLNQNPCCCCRNKKAKKYCNCEKQRKENYSHTGETCCRHRSPRRYTKC